MTYVVADEPVKDEEPKHIEFTARQKYEASDSAVPSNKYWGTAAPGTEVFVASEFGSGSTKANEHGDWLVWVEFPNAPLGKAFAVVVESSDGGRKVFEMIAYGNEPKDVEFSANQKLGENDDNWDKFWGTAQPGATVTATSEFGGATTTVNDHGEWVLEVHFNAPAGTTFAVKISDSNGNAKTFEFTNPEHKVMEFTANQKYGSCGEEVPYDVFWGTAAAGATIWVESPYGSGTTVANGDGHWELRVDFPEAPEGKTFEVVIESSDGGRKVFTFTNIAGDK